MLKVIKEYSNDDYKKGLGSSCRFCSIGIGKYEVEENSERFSLCEEHYKKCMEESSRQSE